MSMKLGATHKVFCLLYLLTSSTPPFMFAAYSLHIWMLLPPHDICTSNIWHLCVGLCQLTIDRKGAQFCCHSCDCGFQACTFRACPCLTRYHLSSCISSRLPFTIRLPKDGSMGCSKDITADAHCMMYEAYIV
jgi:hypothetical protein